MSRLLESRWGRDVIYLFIYLFIYSPHAHQVTWGKFSQFFSSFIFFSAVASPTSIYRLPPDSPCLQLGMARLQHLLRWWKTFHLPYKLDLYLTEYIFHCGNNAVLYCLLQRLEEANGREHREAWGWDLNGFWRRTWRARQKRSREVHSALGTQDAMATSHYLCHWRIMDNRRVLDCTCRWWCYRC